MAQEGNLERRRTQRHLKKTCFCLRSYLPSTHPPVYFAKNHLNKLLLFKFLRWSLTVFRMKFKLLRLADVSMCSPVPDYLSTSNCLWLLHSITLNCLVNFCTYCFCLYAFAQVKFLLPRLLFPLPLTSHPLCLASFYLSFKA